MANPEHIKWLLEGVESWNRRRLIQEFIPDLSGEDIASQLRDAQLVTSSGKPNLEDVNLSQALLSDSDFSDTSLFSANLSRSLLWRTHLDNAQLFYANLSQAMLQEAYLTGADLTFAQLGQANLANCKLAGTKIADADLVGAKTDRLSALAGQNEVASLSVAQNWATCYNSRVYHQHKRRSSAD